MSFFFYRHFWLISLVLFENTKSGETVEQKDAGKSSKEQLFFERETASKMIRDEYHVQMENSIFNEWHSIQDWACNAPQGLTYGTSEFTETVNGKKFNRIMLFGGISPVHFTFMRTTWIYYDEVNSWRTVDNLSVRPPGASIVSMTTVCNEYVILLPRLMNSSTWIFLIKSKEWEELAVDEPFSRYSLYVREVQAVAVKETRTACRCREAVLFIPCGIIKAKISPLHQLSCVNDSGRLSYRWTIIFTKYPKYSRAVSIRCQSVVSSASKNMVFAIIEGCLWYYDVYTVTWTPTASCSKSLQYSDDFSAVTLSAAAPEIDQNITTYLFVNLWDQEVIQFSLSNLTTTSERILGKGPPCLRVFCTRALSRAQFLAYANDDYYSCGCSTWILERDSTSAIWVWSRSSVTVKYSYSIVPSSSSIRYHNVYQLVRRGFHTNYYDLWVLDLNLMRWQLMQRFDEVELGERISKPASIWLEDMWLIVSGSHTTVISSRNQMTKIINPMTSREYFTLVAVNLTSALLFGGLTGKIAGHALNDLWHFSLTTSYWKEVKYLGTLIPSPRYNHAAAVVDSEMFVFGGHNNSDVCFEELWKFSMIQGTWSIVEVRNGGPRLAGLQPCVASAVAQSGQLWIAVGCGKVHLADHICLESEIQMWMFIVHLVIWEPLKVYNTEMFLVDFPQFLGIGYWEEYLISFSNTRGLFYMKVGCPAGFASSNISEIACDTCEVGFYSALGSKTCFRCPRETTTKTDRSTSINECNICVPGYCRHGKCLVVTANSTPSAYCQCQVGFTGNRCQYATYYYISLGVILFVTAIALSLIIICYIRRKKKLGERLLGQQIQQLNGVWQIGWEEVTVQEEIGGGASGRVVLAQYRDLPVAVKMLRTDDDPNDSLKFAEEIKFMQTMRHPNIVLFLGAGKTLEEQPFLVLEFTRRGSLRKVLDDASIELTDRRKIDFAIDAAKGMAFLHNLNPPRIHRDLKGENLLVSESWVVKVADFGLGRPLHSQNKRQHAERKTFKRSITQPLLEDREALSLDGIGTARWSAPELSRREKYDGSIDVYRYTVVIKLNLLSGLL